MRGLLLILVALFLSGVPARAQDQATLIADRVELSGNDQLLASGNVEILYQGDRLKATRVVYDQAKDRVQIEGPLVLTSADGQTLFLADSAELSQDFETGVLRSARLVLNQQLQLAAAEIARIEGRYTQLYKTVASSCTVCENNPTPLWQIRARRVVHDQEERQIYFENARFEVLGVPLLYLPRLRFPDPTLERATGFLTPRITSSDALGVGIKVPYFIVINRSSDLTLTPFLSSSRTATLEGRYRQRFRFGSLEINGAVSDDDIRPGELRGYVSAEGNFDLPLDAKLTFDLRAVSDEGYLLDYGLSNRDRIRSDIQLTRVKRDTAFEADLIGFRSFRDDENNDTLVSLIGEIDYRHRFEPRLLGGVGSYRFAAQAFSRPSTLGVDGPDDDDFVDGRDLGRLTLEASWRRDWLMQNGMIWAALGEARYSFTSIRQDDALEGDVDTFAATAGAELRWPLSRQIGGATHVIEPVAQVLFGEDKTGTLPIEESTQLELDEGNLFSFSRFPGDDRFESGFRANLGLSWTRFDTQGWHMGVTAGRVLRDEEDGQFAGYEALEGLTSDWLAAVHLTVPGQFRMVNRALFNDALIFDRNETRFDWYLPDLSLGGTYTWLRASPIEDRPDDSSELKLDATYDFNENWRANVDYRFDFEQNRAAEAEVGLRYRGECVTVDLSLSRRFTSLASVEPRTNFGLEVGLAGFGAPQEDGARPKRHRKCRN
ncbi:MAG: LPS assembly protein LptD [Pseudomonadota bacterium]